LLNSIKYIYNFLELEISKEFNEVLYINDKNIKNRKSGYKYNIDYDVINKFAFFDEFTLKIYKSHYSSN
jgi:hypothetical protein